MIHLFLLSPLKPSLCSSHLSIISLCSLSSVFGSASIKGTIKGPTLEPFQDPPSRRSIQHFSGTGRTLLPNPRLVPFHLTSFPPFEPSNLCFSLSLSLSFEGREEASAAASESCFVCHFVFKPHSLSSHLLSLSLSFPSDPLNSSSSSSQTHILVVCVFVTQVRRREEGGRERTYCLTNSSQSSKRESDRFYQKRDITKSSIAGHHSSLLGTCSRYRFRSEKRHRTQSNISCRKGRRQNRLQNYSPNGKSQIGPGQQWSLKLQSRSPQWSLSNHQLILATNIHSADGHE